MSEDFVPQHTIGIMSDTHGSLPAWQKALALFGETEALLHAGDVLYHGPRNAISGGYQPADLAEAIRTYEGKILIARGNCDSDVDQMVMNKPLAPYVTLWWQGKHILVMHGDNAPLFRQMALDFKVDLAVSGHTHVARLAREGGTIFLNPGSAAIPKGKEPASVSMICERGPSIFTLDGDLLYRESW